MKKLFPLTLLSIAILSGCNSTPSQVYSSTESAQALAPLVVSPNDTRQYKTLTLANGIDVILVSDPSAEKSAAALSVGVGLLHDPMSQQGLAHYLEHMLFLGTEKYPDTKGYSEFMTKNGGDQNAYTWLDITNYMFKVNNDAYGEALDRFSDFFKAPKLYPEYSDKEKHAVNAEWSMRREMDFFGQYKLARNMMGDHPANRFLIGNLETLGDKETSKLHTEMVNFYDQYYSSNIMKVAMISNKSIAEMEKLADQYFSDIKNKNIDRPKVEQKLDLSKVAGKKIFYKPKEDVKQIKLDFTIDNNMDQFAAKPNYFVTYLIANEMAGSPAQVLKQQGWVSQLSAGTEPDLYGNYGSLTVNIELTDEGMKHREEIVATVMNYINLVKDKGIDSKYFHEIKTALQNQFRFLEKGDEFNYVSNLTDSMQKYPLQHVIDAGFHYAGFDAEAVRNVLNSLNDKSVRIWYVSKQEETDSKLHFYDGEYRIEPISPDEVKSWHEKSQFALQLPSVNKLLPESFDIKESLANTGQTPAIVFDKPGLTIWHLGSQSFAHQPKGSLDISINTPLATQNEKNAILFAVWADLYNLQQSKLITEASVAGVPFSLSASNGLSLNISGFTDKQTVLLEEALKALTIKVDEQSFAQALERQRQAIFNQGQQFPIYQAFGKLSELVVNSSFDDKSVLEALNSVTLKDFELLQKSTLEQHQTRVFSFGNYDQADIDQMAKLLDKTLAPKRVTEFQKAKYWKPESEQVLVWNEDLAVADVAIVDMFMNPTPGYKAKAAAAVLQGHIGTAVFEKLRTEEQLAYAVGASARAINEYSGLAFYIQTPVKNVADMQKRFDEYKHEYAQELATLDSETFSKLKNAVLVSLKEPAKNLSDEVSPFIRDWYKENYNYDSKSKLIAAVEQITIDDVKRYYQETVMNDKAARLNIQLRGKKFASEPFAQLEGQKRIESVDAMKEQVKFQL
ncbi:insulinase family protein [Pseudoalteromonas xiamenensis]